MQFCRKISDLHNQFFIYFSFTLKVFELQRPTIYPKIAFYSCLTKNPQKYCNDLLVAMVLPPKLCKMCGLPPNFERIRFLWWNSSSSYEVSNKWNACKQRGSGVYGLCITRTDAFVWCLGTTTTMWYHKSKKLPWSFQADVFFGTLEIHDAEVCQPLYALEFLVPFCFSFIINQKVSSCTNWLSRCGTKTAKDNAG